LIANAIKFHGTAPPRIHIAADRGEGEWVFSVRDTGIGIAPDYHERIFAIFQRLHTRNQYPGTGIGLAVCKKIVQHHGGRIWVKAVPGDGTSENQTQEGGVHGVGRMEPLVVLSSDPGSPASGHASPGQGTVFFFTISDNPVQSFKE
jgi:signal transduction histidine kinase